MMLPEIIVMQCVGKLSRALIVGSIISAARWICQQQRLCYQLS
jgi:hypothetical protein